MHLEDLIGIVMTVRIGTLFDNQMEAVHDDTDKTRNLTVVAYGFDPLFIFRYRPISALHALVPNPISCSWMWLQRFSS